MCEWLMWMGVCEWGCVDREWGGQGCVWTGGVDSGGCVDRGV